MSINKLNIIILCDNNFDIVGGEQESTKILLDGLKDKYSFGVIQPGKVKNPIPGITYFNLTRHTRIKHLVKNPIAVIKYILSVKKIINANNPKVIHTQAQISFFIIALLKKFRLISKNIYLIHTERGLYTKYNKLTKMAFYFFMKEMNLLITTTKFNMNYWKEALDKRGYSLTYSVIENTAGELFEKYDEKLKKNDEEKITIGFAGRYTGWKNWPLAVEISEKLNEVIGEKLYVKMAVGCLDKKALKKTNLMFERLNEIFGNRFDGKININLKEMDKFYYDIDVFILTSNYNTESFGRTLVEAMSRKTVVFTTDAGGAVEVVGNPMNVCRNADEFVEKVLKVFNDIAKMNEEKEKNFQRVKQLYSLQNNLRKHLYIKIKYYVATLL